MAQLEKIKLTAQTWDSDKDLDKFQDWLDTFSALVRSTTHGAALEDFISYKTGREVFVATNVPSFLRDDPDFYVEDVDNTITVNAMFVEPTSSTSGDPSIPQSAAVVKGQAVPTTPLEVRKARARREAQASGKKLFSDSDPIPGSALNRRYLKKAPMRYGELPVESRELDGLLYNVFKMVVKGSKSGIITCVLFPSYVQAICVLVEHMNISKYDRITRSIFALDKLTYQGDVHKFQVAAMDAIREVRATRANITHLILTRLMKAFEGKSKTVQYKIADIINSGEEIDDTLNLFDIIQSLCSDIATVGDVKNTVNSVMDELKCDFCGFKHKTEECRKKKQALADLAAGNISVMPKKAVTKPFRGNCDLCGKSGHRFKECPDRRSKTVSNVNTDPPAPAEAATVATAVTPSTPLSQSEVLGIMDKIMKGQATVSLSKPRTKVKAREQSSALPPRKSRKHSHAASLLAEGQPFGEYNGNRVDHLHNAQHSWRKPPEPQAADSATQDMPCTVELPWRADRLSASSDGFSRPLGERLSLYQLHPQSACSGGQSNARSPAAEEPPATADEPPDHKHSDLLFMPTVVQPHSHESSLLVAGVQPFGEYKGNRVEECIGLSLCSGMSTGLLALHMVGAMPTRYIAVEHCQTSKMVGENLNAGPDRIQPDHSWASDVFDIDEDKIKNLGHDRIKVLHISAPCKDHSKLRLIPRKGSKVPLTRPGFKGKHGKVFKMCLIIFSWVMLHNPGCEFFCENVDYQDMNADWAETCHILGVAPHIVTADSCSFTRRRRAYWTNIPVPSDFMSQCTPGDPDSCMDGGRTVVKYKAYGKGCVYPVNASWGGPHDTPVCTSARAILVRDIQFDLLQHLRPHEAELLMGLPSGSTAGGGVSYKQRLQCIGEGWDLNVILLFFRHSKLARNNSVPLTVSVAIPQLLVVSEADKAIQQGLLGILHTHGANALANALSQYDQQSQVHMIALVQQAVCSPSTVFLARGSEDSVLDSGSSRHIHPGAVITDAEHSVALTGFDQSLQWTEGGGYLPVDWISRETGSTISYDIDDVDRLSMLSHPIISMGKLIRKGFDFFLGDCGNDMYASAPGGAYTVKLQLGIDDVVRIPHRVRDGSSRDRLPLLAVLAADDAAAASSKEANINNQAVTTRAVNAASRTLKGLNGELLHQMLNHTGEERMYQTLVHTAGFKPIRFSLEPCIWCSLGKSHKTGISHKAHAHNTTESQALTVLLGGQQYVLEISATEEMYNDSDEENPDGDTDQQLDEIEYTADIAGRSLGEQPVPRYELNKLRPFEVMFADNKDYPCAVRGGKQTAFVLVDYYSQAKFKVDVQSKTLNGDAFRRIAVMNGVHKLAYHCRIWTDGCGSMKHVEAAAVKLGVDHAYIPPRDPSLNEAEKVCNYMWAAARAHLGTSQAPSSLMAQAVSYAMYMDLRTASTASRGWKTPYELIKGVQPSLLNLHRWYTKAIVNVPVSKRKYLENQGILDRGEPGRLVGWHNSFSSVYAVMLSNNRLVHSRNVTFIDSDCTRLTLNEIRQELGAQVPLPNVSDTGRAELPADPSGNPLEYTDTQRSNRKLYEGVNIEQCDLFDLHKRSEKSSEQEYFEGTPGKGEWLTHAEPQAELPPRNRKAPDRFKPVGGRAPRGRYAFLCNIVQIKEADSPDCDILLSNEVSSFVEESVHVDHEAVNLACLHLAMVAHKDMSWRDVLQSDDRDLAIRALKVEKDSLMSTILVPLNPDDPEYEEAVRSAISGRYLLDLKRAGVFKARGVKQGFKEDKLTADGPGFVYYAHVAKLVSVRMLLSRPGRGNRHLAIKDVRTAFLQSNKFPDDIVKYVSFKDPVTKVIEYFRQTGPVYGEAGAPVRWENTIAPWLVEEGFERGCNEPAVYYHPEQDVLLLTYVDDLMYDGAEDDISYCDQRLEDRFDCKDTEWLRPDMSVLDYLGMGLMLSSERLYLSMSAYIVQCIALLQLDDCIQGRLPDTPIASPIDTSTEPLSPTDRSWFMTAVGCLGWLVETGRPDVALAHSRIAQHMANPNKSAMDTVRRVFLYLYAARHWTLSCPTHPEEVDLTYHHAHEKLPDSWEFYVDSDFAGNSEEQNRRRSQIGIVALQNGFPVQWSSKVSSVAFADEDIGEAHPDTSSGAAEVYAAGNCTYDFLFLAHVASEMNLDFPRPFKIQMDNSAAECFAKGTAFKSKLKHIDCRQEWVKVLRDRNICTPVHVDSKDNLADMFTKILPEPDFTRLRSKLMYELSEPKTQ